MSKYSKNKIASAIAATLVFASTPTLAENLIAEGTLEELPFVNANLAFNAGPMLSDGTTQAWGQIGTGWCRFINDTMSGKDGDWFRHAPEGNNTNVAYCNHKRTDDNGGIFRQVEGLEVGKSYAISGTGSTRGSLQWAIEYAKVGAEQDEWGNAAKTVVDLTNVVESDLAWVTIEDTMTVPEDADLAQPFKVFIHTQPSTAFPSTDVLETERSQLWVDNFELTAIAEPVEYFEGGDLEGVTGFASGNSAWGNGPKLADGTTAAYSVETAGFKSGWCRFINKERTQTVKAAAGSEAIPAGNDSNSVAFCNHNRNNDAAGIGRIVEGIQAGATYQVSGDASTLGNVRWAYSYFKTDEETVTVVQLTNEELSDGAWVTVSDSFVAPADVDTSKEFKVFIHTSPSDANPGTGDLSLTPRSLLWTDNYSLMGPPSLTDTDEDGVPDSADPFPEDPAASVDTDGDGMPDDYNEDCDVECQEASDLVIDEDDDGDGIDDINDGHPLDGNKNVMVGFVTDSAALVEGEEFVIDASQSIPNSELATYDWSVTGLGSLVEDGGNTATYTAPSDIAAKEDVVISLTVTSATDSATEEFAIMVTNAAAAITPNATMTGMLNTELAYGEKIQLDASSSMDSDGGMLSYKWKVTGVPVELSDDTAVSTSFYVPLVKADTAITIEVTVSNYLTDYDGSYVLDDDGNMIVASSETFVIEATVKKTYPLVEYPLEYFPNGDLEIVTGFITEGWGIGNYGFKEPNAIFTSMVDEDGEKVPAIGQTAAGWSRYINETRTQIENGFDVRAPENRKGVVAFMNHKRKSHLEGLYHEVEGIVPGATYNFSVDAAALGTVQISYRYVKIGAPVDDKGKSEVTTVEFETTAESAYKWVTLMEEFVAPMDIDTSQSFRMVVHTVGDPELNLANTDDARLWMDNLSLQELPTGADADGDSVIDINDGFPLDPSVAADTDGDGLPDSYVKTCDDACQANSSAELDNDDDNDGILDVNDGHPRDSRQSINISVANGSIDAVESEEITIDASATIPSADVATYSWSIVPEMEEVAEVQGLASTQTASASDIVLVPSANGSSVSFMAPAELAAETTVNVMLTIDNGTTPVSETFTVTLTNAPSVVTPNVDLYNVENYDKSATPLVAINASTLEGTLIDSEVITWEAGQVIKLDASSTMDSEDGQLAYTWKAKGGVPIDFSDDSAAVTSFIVPEINIDAVLTLELTVSNYLRDYDGSYITDDQGQMIEWKSEVMTVEANVVKTKQEKPDNGSFGFLSMLLLSGLTLVRRLFKK